MENDKLIVWVAIGIAVAFVICLAGVGDSITPHMGFFVFVGIGCASIYGTLRYMQLVKNKQALKWLVPILALAICNLLFEEFIFTYGNFLFVGVLVAVFTLQLLSHEFPWNLKFVGKAVLTVFGNWYIFIFKLREVFGNKKIMKPNGNLPKILLGAGLALPFLLLIGALLLSADEIFRNIVNYVFQIDIFTWLDHSIFVRIFIGVIVFIYACGYIYNALARCEYSTQPDATVSEGAEWKLDPISASTFVFMLNFVFFAFSLIQFAFLFTGGFLTLPEGVVYSTYARSGFFQLLFVTIINFSVLIFFLYAFGKQKELVQNALLRNLLFGLCFFTAVLVGSSFYRMFMYIGAYGFTPLRMIVLTFLSMEVVLLGGSVAFFRNKLQNLFKFYMITGLVFYILVNGTGSIYLTEKINIAYHFDSVYSKVADAEGWQNYYILKRP